MHLHTYSTDQVIYCFSNFSILCSLTGWYVSLHTCFLTCVLMNCISWSVYLLMLIAHIKHVPYRSMYFSRGHCRYCVSDFFTPPMFFSWDWCMLNMRSHDWCVVLYACPLFFSQISAHPLCFTSCDRLTLYIVSHHFSFVPNGGHMPSIMHPCNSTWHARYPSCMCLARGNCDLSMVYNELDMFLFCALWSCNELCFQ